jgi:GDP-4-dehydro-6-deoxy-D-mannose reductase
MDDPKRERVEAMRILITGVTGMAGSHLAEYVLANHPEVHLFGMCRWRSRMDNLADLAREGKLNTRPLEGRVATAAALIEYCEPGKLNLVYGELNDPLAMQTVIATVCPDRIFHLAAQSFVPASWSAPAETLRVNVIGQVYLFEAVRAAGIDPQIHVAGSSEEYGLVHPDELPIKESNPLRPLSPYGVSKVAQENLAWQYHRSYGLKTVVTRGFNHEGPRRGEVFVTSSFAKQIAMIEGGLRNPPVIYVGDLSSERDWTDVRDMARAYWLTLEHGVPGEVYNIACGVRRSVAEMLELLLTLTDARIQVEQDPARLRPSDVKVLHGDSSKFRALTGWEPRISFEQMMRDSLDWWRAKLDLAPGNRSVNGMGELRNTDDN